MKTGPGTAAGSTGLAAALRLVQATEEDWPKGDLPDLMDAQLALPAPSASGMCWRDVLTAPPSLDAIIALKDAAKDWLGAGSAMPAEIARILYVTAIASASLNCGATISRLPNNQLAWHRAWALSQVWADHDLLGIIRRWAIDAED